MAIELTYGDDADQQDIDRAILRALDAKQGYVVQLTTEKSADDVVIDRASDDTLYAYMFDLETKEPTGPRFAIDAADIWGIKVY